MAQVSAEKLEHTGLLKRKEWPQCHRESSWQERRSRLCQKKKEQNRQSRAPDHEGGESKGEQEMHLGEIEGDQCGSMKKGGLHSEGRQIPRRKRREGKRSLP